MIQRRQQLGLALEARQPLGIAGENVRQELEGDLAIQGGVVSQENLAHPSLPQVFDDSVVRNGLADLGHLPSGASVGVILWDRDD